MIENAQYVVLSRLKELRILEGKKQREVAEYLNISRQYYGEYELGKRKIPADIIIHLAKYYETTAGYVLGLEDKRRKMKYD